MLSELAILAHHLTVQYPESPHPVFQNLSLEVSLGEFVVLHGPTGCGKTTLLYCIAGIIPKIVPARIEGTLQVLGNDVRSFPPSSSPIAFIPQRIDAALPLTSTTANLCLLSGASLSEVDQILKQLGLGASAALEVWKLSRGKQTLVALAAALLRKPRLLLIDEAFSNLDLQSGRLALQLIEQARRQNTLTVLAVEHWFPKQLTNMISRTLDFRSLVRN